MANASTHRGGSNDEAIAELEARLAEIQAGNLDPYAFTSRTLIQATFPHSSRSGKEVVLINGDMKVTMYSPTGLPYGTYPRLIMCWLTREAIRRKHLPLQEARVIPLGNSLSQFLREIGNKTVGGGPDGNVTRLRKQMKALFSTFISIEVTGTERSDGASFAFQQVDNTLVAESAMLWWDPKRPEQMGLQESSVTLTPGFYHELTRSAVPLDTAILRQIRRSPLAIDIYCWLTYRLSYHKGITVVTWDQLRQQFGAGYADTKQGKRDFKKKVVTALDKVLEAWPAATVTVADNGLMLRPGEPSVPKKVQEEITKHYNNNGDSPF